ncbi:MAG: DUF4097 family beta strand repeat protein [Cyclobacteriaceae bacterium]|nr:DUF4097 family beta strand repeat protein [Cytophagales bacterium]MBX2898343.1 DUF4097 family beta strand repeat protein [Cyclobacteriaceae bacterium]
MKKQFLVWMFCLSAAAAIAQTAGEFPVPLSDPAKRGKLRAHLNYGSITVKGTSRKDVLVKYSGKDEESKKPKESPDGLKRIGGSSLNLEVSENNNEVKVQSGSWNTKMSLEIEVPAGFDLKVSSYNDGDIYISNVQGEVEITTYNGEIKAESISGSVVATTYNGDIRVDFNKITDVPMSYSTYNGDVDITFPPSVKTTLKMKTQRGEILSAFDMNVIRNEPVKKKDAGSGSFKVVLDEWVKAEIGGGGPELSMRTYNGDIKIRKK